MRKILVTSALPYANGPIHLGHLVEYIQTDIWVRAQKMSGNACLYICGDDAHGTPIMLSAQQQNISPEQLIAQTQSSHEQDFADFHIQFDNYYTTHSTENRELAESIYNKLYANGDIETRTIEQAYDETKAMFLPDRFVKGQCPRCGAQDQYGDSCEVCGATYSPTDLINPISVVSNTPPVQKETEQYFFRLEKYETMLREWATTDHLQPEVAHKLNEWFDAGLKQWNISRDAPYFGFEIPNAPNKYFYVWLDAPMGYISILKNLCERVQNLRWEDYWQIDNDTDVYHFVGKDLVYFHALFWPAILTGAGYRKPTEIFTHGFLTVNGQKMSKSRGTFIRARDYLQHLDAEALRYYFASKLTNRIDDIDLNFDNLLTKVNSDLIGKVINIASRCAGFITKKHNGMLASAMIEPELYAQFSGQYMEISHLYEEREYAQAMREIMLLADKANHYINESQPWVLAKQPGMELQVQQICTVGLNLFRVLMVYLMPVLPATAKKVETFLNDTFDSWKVVNEPLLDHTINKFTPLMQRIEKEQIDKIFSSNE